MSTGLADWKYGGEALFLLGVSFRIIRWAIAAKAESESIPTGGLEYLPGLLTTMKPNPEKPNPDGTTETVTATTFGGGSGFKVSVRTERHTFVAGPGSKTAVPELLLDKLTPEQKKLVLEKLQEAERMIAGQPPVTPAPKTDK